LALRGGNYNNSGGAGLFGLNLNNNRTNRNRNVGFRPALAPIRQKPGGHGCRDGTGAKGGRFLPGAKRGNNSVPARLVDYERGAGATFFRKESWRPMAAGGVRPGYAAVRRCAAATTIVTARAFLASTSKNNAPNGTGMWVSVPLSPWFVGSPAVMAAGTVQGQKGAASSPARSGETTAPPRG